MSDIFRGEIKKVLKNPIFKSLAVILVALIILICLGIRNSGAISVYEFQVLVLTLANQLFISTLFVILCGYIMGLELDCKTLKIIRAKSINLSKIYIAKFLVGLGSVFLIYFSIFIISSLFGNMYCAGNKDTFTIYELTELSRTEALLKVIEIYLLQVLASIFILSLTFCITVWTQNKFLAILLIPIFMIVVEYVGTLLQGRLSVIFLKHLNSGYIYLTSSHLFLYCAVLIIYSLMINLLSIRLLKNRQILI